MSRKPRKPLPDPDEPGIDEETRLLRRSMVRLQNMSVQELAALAVRAGIYTEDGQLTPPYRDDAPPSACRPYRNDIPCDEKGRRIRRPRPVPRARPREEEDRIR